MGVCIQDHQWDWLTSPVSQHAGSGAAEKEQELTAARPIPQWSQTSFYSNKYNAELLGNGHTPHSRASDHSKDLHYFTANNRGFAVTTGFR